MYWNKDLPRATISNISLNNNIGCIEIAFRDCNQDHKMWLNNNMGCIEIKYSYLLFDYPVQLNNNMECIEIPTYLLCHF